MTPSGRHVPQLRLLALAIALCLLPEVGQAHNVGAGLFGHTLSITLESDAIRLEYTIEIPTSVLLKEFWDFLEQNQQAPVGDKDRYISSVITKRIARGIVVIANGQPVPLTEIEALQERTGFGDYNFFQYRIRLEGPLHGQNRSVALTVINKNYTGFRGVFFTSLAVGSRYRVVECSLRYPGQRFLLDTVTGMPWSLWEGHRTIEIELRPPRFWEAPPNAGADKVVVDNRTVYAAQQAAGPAVPGEAMAGRSDRTAPRLAKMLHATNLSAGLVIVALGTAIVLGGVHALSPGHGKSLVAAYLVGTRGRGRDAVILAGIVTLTHVMSVVILGAVTLAASRYFVPEQVLPYIEVGSGVLIVALGAFMVWSRRPGRHTHTHPPLGGSLGTHSGEDHAHVHHTGVHLHPHGGGPAHEDRGGPGEKLRIRELAVLGFSGGIVPCPSALVILLMAIALHRVAFGLALIVAFSVGLASVLIVMGLAVVRAGASFLARSGRASSPLVDWLPALSGTAIVLIGVAIILRGLGAGGSIGLSLFGG
jgi:ABC-type nickel/cobalt efflux system permease component RcnA